MLCSSFCLSIPWLFLKHLPFTMLMATFLVLCINTCIWILGKMALCYDIEQILSKGTSISPAAKDNRLTVIQALIQGGSNYNRKNQRHSKMIETSIAYYNSPFSHILRQFQPVLSIPALISIRTIVLHCDNSQDDLLRELTMLTQKVQPLKFMCRLQIRDLLKGKCLQKTDLLPLPKSLKEYVLLME